jgi:hypothetical protein
MDAKQFSLGLGVAAIQIGIAWPALTYDVHSHGWHAVSYDGGGHHWHIDPKEIPGSVPFRLDADPGELSIKGMPAHLILTAHDASGYKWIIS